MVALYYLTELELLRHEKARESEASKSRNCPLLNFSIRHRKKERKKEKFGPGLIYCSSRKACSASWSVASYVGSTNIYLFRKVVSTVVTY